MRNNLKAGKKWTDPDLIEFLAAAFGIKGITETNARYMAIRRTLHTNEFISEGQKCFAIKTKRFFGKLDHTREMEMRDFFMRTV